MAIVVIPRRMPYGDVLLLPEFPPDDCPTYDDARSLCLAYTQEGGYHHRCYLKTMAGSKRIEVEEALTLPVVAEFTGLGNDIRIMTMCSNKSFLTRLTLSGCKPRF